MVAAETAMPEWVDSTALVLPVLAAALKGSGIAHELCGVEAKRRAAATMIAS